MPSLKIPDSGLLLESPDYNSGESSPQLPLQAFAISLSESVIEDMIKCVQNGKEIELSLGSTPTFFYGSNEHVLSPDSESFTYDLVLSKPNDPQRKHYRLPNPTMSFWDHPSRGKAVRQISGPKQTTKFGKNQTPKPSGDADIDALRSSFAQAEGEKRQSVIIDKPLPSKKTAKSKSGLMSMASIGGGSVSRSLPSSPAQNPVASSQLTMERAKEHRFMIIHELASAERPYTYLRDKWEGDDKDFKAALEKAADFNDDTQRWFLKKLFWKELNVWEYPYGSDTDRDLAISHAIGKYDRVFRLGPSDPLWQMLLPKEERGKGKCLSRLQPTLARGAATAAPKIKVQKADDANGDGNDSDASKSKGGENMARSNSQPLPAKSKKINDVKKILPPAKKPAAAKASPMGRNGAKPITNGKFKSAEFVEDSSDDDDEGLPLSKPKPEARLEARPTKETKEPAAAAAPKPKPKPKPVAKEVLKPQPAKRMREDDDSSSSSGTPLSKRIKQKEHIRPPVALKHRPSDASQNSRNSSGSTSFKASKNTSPAKSSPLASSPPTNAADLDEADSASTPQTEPETLPKPRAEVVTEKTGMKRKAGAAADETGKSKKARTMEEISKKAAKFHKYWETYAALHRELEALEETQRPAGKVADLYDMRGRLEVMKFEITRDSVEVG